jgi:DNA (cytosine-5)-methyltransferase 1
LPGIQRINPADGPIGRFLMLPSELGYEVAYDVVDFLDYGVPQTRRRLVMTASLMGRFTLPEPVPKTDGGSWQVNR